jgi:hypothetical protein
MSREESSTRGELAQPELAQNTSDTAQSITMPPQTARAPVRALEHDTSNLACFVAFMPRA